MVGNVTIATKRALDKKKKKTLLRAALSMKALFTTTEKPDASQKVIVVEELGVLAGLPQTEEAEVKIRLDHLLTCKGGRMKDNILSFYSILHINKV